MPSNESSNPSGDNPFFEIVPATLSHAASIANLGGAVWIAAFGWSVSQADSDAYIKSAYTTEAWEKELADPNSETYVARPFNSESEIFGFTQIKRGTSEPCLENIQGRTVELHRIYVDSKMHGKGVGKALLKFADDLVKEQGFEYIWLGVWEKNEKAKKLYESMGYAATGHHDFVIGEEIQTDLILVKKL